MIKVKDAMRAMETIAPAWLALDGDPVGLHAGDPEAGVKKITVALDASLGAIAAAAADKAQMLIVHHPRFYRGLATLAECDSSGRRAAAIVRSGLAVFSAHTNLDLAEGGTNDLLAKACGLLRPEVVKEERREGLLKLAVFVPASHAEPVRRALCDAGAGAIGAYSDCTFRTRGVGTFRGGPNTNPFIGKPGILEEADEFRLETVFGERAAERVLAAMRSAHPYEEIAYDLYPLLGKARGYGLGRVGDLPEAEPLAAFAARVATACGSTMCQYGGKATRRIKRVAVWAGGGVDVLALASCGAQAVVAGEIGYHDVETFMDGDVAVITLGHGPSEDLVVKPLAARLSGLLPGVTVKATGAGRFPLRNVP